MEPDTWMLMFTSDLNHSVHGPASSRGNSSEAGTPTGTRSAILPRWNGVSKTTSLNHRNDNPIKSSICGIAVNESPKLIDPCTSHLEIILSTSFYGAFSFHALSYRSPSVQFFQLWKTLRENFRHRFRHFNKDSMAGPSHSTCKGPTVDQPLALQPVT